MWCKRTCRLKRLRLIRYTDLDLDTLVLMPLNLGQIPFWTQIKLDRFPVYYMLQIIPISHIKCMLMKKCFLRSNNNDA